MHWDGTISVGNVLTAAVLFLGFYGAHKQNIARLERIEMRLELIFGWWKRNAIKGMEEGNHES